MNKLVNACATCASTFDSITAPLSEKPLLPGRDLHCCGRSVCSRCLNQNKRYETYCPYCQITTEPSLLPQGLKDPPPYSTVDSRLPLSRNRADDELPAYSEHRPVQSPVEKSSSQPAEDVLHFVRPNDSLHSLGLAYGVPLNALRKTNSIYSDHLVQARKTILIPGEYYKGGVSLSAQPIEGEEEEARKNKLRRFQVATKVSEYVFQHDLASALILIVLTSIPPTLRYDVAQLYLKNADWILEAAIEAYREDEQWEKDHPLEAKQNMRKGKNSRDAGMRRFVGSSTTVR